MIDTGDGLCEKEVQRYLRPRTEVQSNVYSGELSLGRIITLDFGEWDQGDRAMREQKKQRELRKTLLINKRMNN